MAREFAKGKIAISEIGGGGGTEPKAESKQPEPKVKVPSTKAKAGPKLTEPNDINVCW